MRLSTSLFITTLLSTPVLAFLNFPAPAIGANLILQDSSPSTNPKPAGKALVEIDQTLPYDVITILGPYQQVPITPTDPNPLDPALNPIPLGQLLQRKESLSLPIQVTIGVDSKTFTPQVTWEGQSGGLSHLYYKFYPDLNTYHGYYVQNGNFSIQPSPRDGGLIRGISFSPFAQNSLTKFSVQEINRYPLVPGLATAPAGAYRSNYQSNGDWLSTLNYATQMRSADTFNSSDLKGFLQLDIATVAEFLSNSESLKIPRSLSEPGKIKIDFIPKDPVTGLSVKIKNLAEAMGLKYLTWAQKITGGKVRGHSIEFYSFLDDFEDYKGLNDELKADGYQASKNAYDESLYLNIDQNKDDASKAVAIQYKLLEEWNKIGFPFIPKNNGVENPTDPEKIVFSSPLESPDKVFLLEEIKAEDLWDALPTVNGKGNFLVEVAKDSNGKYVYYSMAGAGASKEGTDEYPFYYPFSAPDSYPDPTIERDNDNIQMTFSDIPRMCDTGSLTFKTMLVGVGQDNQLVELPEDLGRIGAQWTVSFDNPRDSLACPGYYIRANYQSDEDLPGSGVITYLKVLRPGYDEVVIDAENGIGLEYIPDDFFDNLDDAGTNPGNSTPDTGNPDPDTGSSDPDPGNPDTDPDPTDIVNDNTDPEPDNTPIPDSDNTGNDTDTVTDAASVPEPSSMIGLLAFTLGGLALRTRKRLSGAAPRQD